MHRRIPCFVLLLATLPAAHADPAPEPFLGTWRVVAGVPAAIDDGPPATPDTDVLGATVTFADGTVQAPAPLGCGGAHYTVETLPADMLFQGTLGASAAARADALDLAPDGAPTLMVRCDTGLFDYHRTRSGDAAPERSRLLIMLDRVIYSLERDPATPD